MMTSMKPITFRPLGNRYLVLPDEAEDKSEQIGEYTISQKKDEHERPVEGVVVAKGLGCGELDIGAKAVYGKYSGYEQELDGVKYLILAESEILGERLKDGI